MKITYLGHSGFCVETPKTIIIMDPWLSKSGAFDAAWFQYPKNQHLASQVEHLLATTRKEKFIYISHEHKDHFDLDFLMSLKSRDFTILLADFHLNVVEEDLKRINYVCKNILSLKDNEPYSFKDGKIVLFIIDMELDADSTILVQSESCTFLNLNDSKPHDRLRFMVDQYGPIDVFSGQFSGAIWHPTCYQMDKSHYEDVCKTKNKNKFDTIVKSLDILKPAVFLPSAGPPCFLDPQLFSIQAQPINTYPRARQLLDFLDEHYKHQDTTTRWFEIMPGDELDVQTRTFTALAKNRVDDAQFMDYITAYAKEYEDFFKARDAENAKINPNLVFMRLKKELRIKLDRMSLVRYHIKTKLYFSLTELKTQILCVDFQHNTVSIVSEIEDPHHFFSISAPAWQVEKVLSRLMTWADFALAFRVRLERVPETYNTLLHAFLTLNEDRLAHFCTLYHHVLSKQERIEVKSGDKYYSILRYCPHQGGDLTDAIIENGRLKCPRHSWTFDLENGGRCLHNDTHIEAQCTTRKEPA